MNLKAHVEPLTSSDKVNRSKLWEVMFWKGYLFNWLKQLKACIKNLNNDKNSEFLQQRYSTPILTTLWESKET